MANKKNTINIPIALVHVFSFLFIATVNVDAQINSPELPINIDAESTGYLADEFSLETLQVAVREDVDLSIPVDLPDKDGELDFLPVPDPVNKVPTSTNPETKNVLSNP